MMNNKMRFSSWMYLMNLMYLISGCGGVFNFFRDFSLKLRQDAENGEKFNFIWLKFRFIYVHQVHRTLKIWLCDGIYSFFSSSMYLMYLDVVT